MTFVALARTHHSTDGHLMLRTVVAPIDDEEHAVDRHETFRLPGGPDPDPPVSDGDRVAQVLAELGWQAEVEAVLGRPFAVTRAARFTVHQVESLDGERYALITNLEGDPVARVRLTTTMAHDLAAESWTLGPRAPGWPDGVHEAAATDWTAVLEQSTHHRAVARAQAADAAKRWTTAIREAMLAGVDARALATLGGITVQRVYQIRDRRR